MIIKWLFERKFYSICSMHKPANDKCELCKIGDWHYTRKLQIESFFHKYFYQQMQT